MFGVQPRGVGPLNTSPFPPGLAKGSSDKEKRKRYHKWSDDAEFPKVLLSAVEENVEGGGGGSLPICRQAY